ncbi:Wzz/FepE/Etk N-terminal domain-containing protein [Sphingomonas sp. BGYR3]|uniref:GumC family protein n=1 Tax=Sphingomonas sp. BGYR3 TaxID=2975483 RepID=UPI0021A42AFC|nr:Wzz/FepE/Etk N-terminal domain-containing protein [Sphingomonas sp. BGYR3]MDG5489259.1 Wzz/FepE/Etk N-terminal domain-containing protein [Sphingomonas sp. BGYR3]
MYFVSFFRALWARRKLIVSIMLACLIGASVVSIFVPTKYKAQARVMLDVIRPDPVTNEVINAGFARAFAQTQVELFADPALAARAITDLGWPKREDLRAAYVASTDQPSEQGFIRWLAQGVTLNTTARVIEGTNVLEIEFVDTNPDRARTIADALRQAYIEQSIDQRRETATRNADWFANQTEKIRRELNQAESQRTAFERANNIVLQDDYSDTESARLKALAGTTPMPSMPSVSIPVGPGPAQTQLAQIDGQIAALSRELGPNHPDLVALRQTRTAVAQAAAQERAAAAASRAPAATGPSIASQVSQTQAKVIAQRDEIAQLRQMQARIDGLREQFSKAASRTAELRQQAQAREGGITLLGQATTSNKPVGPLKAVIIGGAAAFGLVLGILLALLFELLRRRVRSVSDLSIESVPVIAIIPFTNPDRRVPATGA